ncbi:fimbrial protein [uncultured Bacteroides sp.]|uniref:fimbrial protein n=1 Tax=uncultured Bacteroides sp. TaxID=162156 RepID=UPI002AAA6F95|nr:fimbrial protein [uncultured Bacteroides sp.]
MKKRFLFLVGIGVLLAMSSCSKEEDNLVVKKGEPAALTLTLKGTDVNTRATSPVVSLSEENKVNRVTVGLFKTNTGEEGKTDIIKEFTFSNGSPTTIQIKGSIIHGSDDIGNRDVVVVANADENTFTGATTKTEFLSKLINLKQDINNLPMIGNGNVTLSADITDPSQLTINLTRMVARVQLTSLSTDFDPAGQYPNAVFKADGIYLLKANGTSQANGTVSNPLNGWTYQYPTNSGTYPLRDHFSSPILISKSPAYTTNHYFYTFPNVFPSPLDPTFADATKLVIEGVFDADGDLNTTSDQVNPCYYPIVVNRILGVLSPQQTLDGYNTGIKRNTIYSISVVIKNIGVNNTSTIIDPAYLNVTVVPQNWQLAIDQPVDF